MSKGNLELIKFTVTVFFFKKTFRIDDPCPGASLLSSMTSSGRGRTGRRGQGLDGCFGTKGEKEGGQEQGEVEESLEEEEGVQELGGEALENGMKGEEEVGSPLPPSNQEVLNSCSYKSMKGSVIFQIGREEERGLGRGERDLSASKLEEESRLLSLIR